jgi:hypothetical protein
MHRLRQGLLLTLTGLVLGVAACAREDAPAPSGSSPAASAVQVTDVRLGRTIGGDKRVVDEVGTFGPNDVIYASVLTSGTSSNASLRIRWSYQDGQTVEESEQSIAPSGDAATEFHISKPDGWPAGRYKAEVFLNGTLVQTEEFEVQ